MTPDEYLQGILNREAVNTGIFSPVRGVHTVLDPIIREWAGNRLLSMHPSGSFMKGTANKRYAPTRQNVSINVRINGYSVDLVPGKRQNSYGNDHSLYRRKACTWTKTNVVTHINHVIGAGHLAESRVIKLWRNQKGLDFPSFYLELTVIDALSQQFFGTLSDNVWKIFQYLRDRFSIARVVDPANTNNIISDDLSAAERTRIKAAAEQALKASNWSEIVT